MYALNLGSDGRILSATFDEYAPEGQPRVNVLPDGDITDYLYIDGEYIYDPLPEAEQVEPTPTPSDSERITALEDTIMEIISGVMDLQ